jgi:AcrR family transcriptional regulator
MARMSPDERRAAIVDATLEVMIRKGIGATTVRDVAMRMGTSSGLVHHYFASMDDLLAAAFEQAAAGDLTLIATAMAHPGLAGDAVGRLRVFFATYTRAEQDWAFQLWLDAWAEATRRPAIGAASQRLNIAWQQLLATAIRAGVQQRTLRCPDPDAAAWRILSLLDGLVLQAVAHRATIAPEQVISWSAGFAEAELGLPAGTLLADPGGAVPVVSGTA